VVVNDNLVQPGYEEVYGPAGLDRRFFRCNEVLVGGRQRNIRKSVVGKLMRLSPSLIWISLPLLS
jgi:hypothetical protein